MRSISQKAVDWALSKVGCAYSQSKRAQDNIFDCSSLVARAYSAQGKKWKYGGSIPTSMYEVYDDEFELIWPDSYAKIGKSLGGRSIINLANHEGDLQFICTDSTTKRSNRITHVAMVTSARQIVHARNTKYGVRKDSFELYAGKICAVVRYNPSCDLRKGMCGWRTLSLQKALNRNGASLAEDGEYGKNTELAVKDFQQKNGLNNTGVADTVVFAQLQLLEDSINTATSINADYVRISGNNVNIRIGPGTQYAIVRIVHNNDVLRKINTEGWVAIEVDGNPYWICDRYLIQQETSKLNTNGSCL